MFINLDLFDTTPRKSASRSSQTQGKYRIPPVYKIWKEALCPTPTSMKRPVNEDYRRRLCFLFERRLTDKDLGIDSGVESNLELLNIFW
jgi:hypothetical protein